MCKNVGEVKKVEIKLPAGFVGSFVRIKVKLDVQKKLSRFVSITKDGKKEFYQVKYEKLPTFCGHCGMIGHWFEECGTGEHDGSKLEWGDFILADGGRGRGRGRGLGRGRGSGGRGEESWGRGRGRGFGRGAREDPWEEDAQNQRTEMDVEGSSPQNSSIRKRLALDSSAGMEPNKGIVSVVDTDGRNSKVLAIVGQFEDEVPPEHDAGSTPQKNANKKKLKTGEDGSRMAQTNEGSAASGEDRREQ
jgi:hypothetical protein